MTEQAIKTLKNEAFLAGDLRMAMICDLAIDGEYGDCEPGTEMDELRVQGVTQEQAMEIIEETVNEAATSGR